MRSRGYSVPQAAEAIDVGDERLRRYLDETGVGEKRGGRWQVKANDERVRDVPIFSRGKRVTVTVNGYDEARKAGSYMGTVAHFLATNDARVLVPFKGDGVTDAKGKTYSFETRPNTLYRLASDGPEPWEHAYRITVPAA